jgi:hypothetical protein
MRKSSSMKKVIILCISLCFSFSALAQGTWSHYASVEENIHFSDIPAAYNYSIFSLLSANSGMRLGGYYTHNDQLSGEITLGVTGIGTPGSFSRKIVPMEFIGHYNLLTSKEGALVTKFNFSAGIGSGLAESLNGRFGFSEHIVFGANMEMGEVLPFGTLIMGTRYTMYVDDYIDGLVVSGSGNDAVLRFYTAIRLDGMPKRASQKIATAEKIASKLRGELIATNETHEAEKSALIDNIDRQLGIIDSLETSLKACNDSLTPALAEANQSISTASLAKGYYVIIGSFPAPEMAEEYVSSLELEDLNIVFEETLDTYRVVFSQHENIGDAVRSRDEAKAITQNAWIAVY